MSAPDISGLECFLRYIVYVAGTNIKKSIKIVSKLRCSANPAPTNSRKYFLCGNVIDLWWCVKILGTLIGYGLAFCRAYPARMVCPGWHSHWVFLPSAARVSQVLIFPLFFASQLKLCCSCWPLIVMIPKRGGLRSFSFSQVLPR